jgi:hypothetical protein
VILQQSIASWFGVAVVAWALTQPAQAQSFKTDSVTLEGAKVTDATLDQVKGRASSP